jgi:hypothetical protein
MLRAGLLVVFLCIAMAFPSFGAAELHQDRTMGPEMMEAPAGARPAMVSQAQRQQQQERKFWEAVDACLPQQGMPAPGQQPLNPGLAGTPLR